MIQSLKYFLTAFFLLLVISVSRAQSYSVDIKVEKAFFNGYTGDKYGPRIRIYKDEWKDDDEHALWHHDGDCIKLASNITTGTITVDKTYHTSLQGKSTFNLIVVTHEERKDGSEDCTAEGVANLTTKKPDIHQERSDQSRVLFRLRAGERVDVRRFNRADRVQELFCSRFKQRPNQKMPRSRLDRRLTIDILHVAKCLPAGGQGDLRSGPLQGADDRAEVA